MLKRLLLNLKSLLKPKLPLSPGFLPSSRSDLSENPENLAATSATSTTSTQPGPVVTSSYDSYGNLLPNVAQLQETETSETHNIKTYQFFILILCSLFIFLIFVNTALTLVLGGVKNSQQDLVTKLSAYDTTKNQLLDIQSRTNFYKTISGQRSFISDKVAYVVSSIPKDLTPTSFQVDSQKFSITLHGQNAASFTSLILQYLQKDKVKAITITSASFDTHYNYFIVGLEGDFK